MQYLTGFLSFFMLILVLFAAYIATKWYAAKMQQMVKGKYLKVIDRIILGKDKGLLIIQIGQKYYLMSENASGLTNIIELNEEDLIAFEDDPNQVSFKSILKNYLGLPQNEEDESMQLAFDKITDLKNRISSSLNRMVKRHKGEEKTNDEKEEI